MYPNCPRNTYKGGIYDTISIGDSSDYRFDERNPKLKDETVDPPCYHGTDEFDQWYNDVSGVNRPFQVMLPFLRDEDGILYYWNENFFPIDDDSAFVPLSSETNTYGHRQPDPYDNHNYGFTMEFHAYFTYVEGANQTFTFSGDDDVWVFINDSLVIDIAGVHSAITDSVNLDEIAPGFLEDGETYIFDFFFAERHTSKSRCYITTSIPILEPERTKIVKAKIRDFKEKNTIDTTGMHPDFNYYTCGPVPGMVQPKIATTVPNSPFPGDNRQIVLKQGAQCATSTSNFGHWYNDYKGINRPFYIDIAFDEVPGEPGVYGISFPSFFPIDNDSDWTPAYPGGPDPYGHLQTSHPEHNYGFTTEIHTQITYLEGTGQFFIFRGDDDVWVFVNDSLVMDLGGVHSAIADTIRLDSLPDGFLKNGHVYPFDFFHAERYIPDSRVTIKTNFQLDTYVFEGITTFVQFSNYEDFSDVDSLNLYRKASQTLYIQVYDDSRTKGVDTTEIELNGPNGETETVTLIESGTGTYIGSIEYG
ncbi:MAG: fibro-slime domain-containing protein, partial [Chitinivibrionales bacterium]|nr:fibro-slime domain-containing protein [Chitinivibrionales bacterium]